MMLKYIIVTVLAKVCLAKLEQLSYPDPGRKDFDFLIFAQDWPISDCIQWETKTTKNECSIKSKIPRFHYRRISRVFLL